MPCSHHAPSSDLLHSLRWLPVHRRIEFKAVSLFQGRKTRHCAILRQYVTATGSSVFSAFFHHRHVNCSSNNHFTWTLPFFHRRITNLGRSTTRVATVYTLFLVSNLILRLITSAVTWTSSTSPSSRASDCLNNEVLCALKKFILITDN